jgi:hypothetical protein
VVVRRTGQGKAGSGGEARGGLAGGLEGWRVVLALQPGSGVLVWRVWLVWSRGLNGRFEMGMYGGPVRGRHDDCRITLDLQFIMSLGIQIRMLAYGWIFQR